MGSPQTAIAGPLSERQLRRRLMLRDSITFAALLSIAILLFIPTLFLVKSFNRHKDALARRWFAQGQQALAAGKAKEAVDDFQTALEYAPDSRWYEMRLANALGAAGDTDAAASTFSSLWETEPGNGLLNLELARLAVRQGHTTQAVNFFHGAIYGNWDEDAIDHRRESRLELVNFLLAKHQTTQAQAELLSASGGLPPGDAADEKQVAGLMLQASDPEHALKLYQEASRNDPQDAEAHWGAGHAAFSVGRYKTAAEELRTASELAEGNPLPAYLQNELLEADEVIQHLPAATSGIGERAERTRALFERAGRYLDSCMAPADFQSHLNQSNSNTPKLADLKQQWSALQPGLRGRGLERDPQMETSALRLVYSIEQTLVPACGNATPLDESVLRMERAGDEAGR